MNTFGGTWTENKLLILEEYAKAYLQIMKNHPYWTKLYFDGFAGSGEIRRRGLTDKKIFGSALRIVDINDPIPFDEYYFVEKDQSKLDNLRKILKEKYPNKDNIYFVPEDCNQKLLDLARFLRTEHGKNYKVLAYIDPCGMQLNWSSLESIRGLSVDMWILVPTGMGVNRLLKKNGDIDDSWIEKLKIFLGLSKESILDHFYRTRVEDTLFGEVTESQKIKNAIDSSAELYKKRLKEIFDFVTEPYILQNKRCSIMYHFFMASNNETAYKIAMTRVNKYNLGNYGTL